MAHRVCPWWLGYALLNPLRRLREDPSKVLGPWIGESMTVLELGCGMGFFTLEIARRVGRDGRVVAVDIQEKMLRRLRARAARAGLASRLDARLATPNDLGIGDLTGAVDLAAALHLIHEDPDPRSFFAQVLSALRPGAPLLVVEPPGHVSAKEMNRALHAAAQAGLILDSEPLPGLPRSALLRAPA